MQLWNLHFIFLLQVWRNAGFYSLPYGMIALNNDIATSHGAISFLYKPCNIALGIGKEFF